MTKTDEILVCEALVREIGRATRWSAVKEAWSALLHVRLMAQELMQEEGEDDFPTACETKVNKEAEAEAHDTDSCDVCKKQRQGFMVKHVNEEARDHAEYVAQLFEKLREAREEIKRLNEELECEI